MIFYERLNALIKKSKITRKKLCKDIGIPYETLNSMIKRDSSHIDIELLKSAAMYFSVSSDWLIGLDTKSVTPIPPSVVIVEKSPFEFSMTELSEALLFKSRRIEMDSQKE